MPGNYTKIKNNFLDIIIAALKNNLDKIKIKWNKNKCMTVVLCANGYPGKYKKNLTLKNISNLKLPKNMKIFHAGTKIKDKRLVTNGGRVLNVNFIEKIFIFIKKLIYKKIKKINWKQGFCRSDIGWRVT